MNKKHSHSRLLTFFLFLWGKLSFKCAQRLGWLLGSLLFYIKNDMRRIASINLDLCFPDLGLREKKRLLKSILQHTCMTGSEMPAILFKSPEKLLAQLHTVEGHDLMQSLYAEKKGVMVLSLHIGCYEIGSMYYAENYPETAMLYTQPKIKTLNMLILRARSRLCKNMSPANRSGVKNMMHALANKNVIAMLTDQVPVDAGGTHIDFFGNPALTMNFPDKLYKKYKPNVVFSYPLRDGVGKGIRLIIEDLTPLIQKLEQMDNINDPVAYALNQRFEEVLQQYPEQYQWTYKRFKYHPDGLDYYEKDIK